MLKNYFVQKFLWRLLSVSVLLVAGAAHGLEVLPGALALRHSQRKAVKGIFTIKNDTPVPVRVSSEVSPYFGFEDGWDGKEFRLSPAAFRLGPGKTRKVSLSARLRGPMAKEKALKVSFRSRPEGPAAVSTVLSQAVYFVPEKPEVGLSVDSFTLQETSRDRWDATAAVSNRGNVHLLSAASVSIRSAGKDLSTLRAGLRVIVPGGRDVFSWSWDSSPQGARPSGAGLTVHYRPPFGAAEKLEAEASVSSGLTP